MADLRRELRAASFRGVAFLITDDDTTSGRRIVTHEYPGKDLPSHEDLGQLPNSINLQAVVIGTGYVAAAQSLEELLLKPGAGTLVHPHLGTLQVVVKDVRRVHSVAAIGEVRFSISFERTDDATGVTVAKDTGRSLTETADAMFTQALTDFETSLAGQRLASFVEEDGVRRLNDYLGEAQQLLSYSSLDNFLTVPQISHLFGGSAGEIVNLFQSVSGFLQPARVPVVGALPVAAPTINVPGLVSNLNSAAAMSMDASINPNSPSRAAIVNNAAAITSFMQANLLATAGAAARYANYESRELALNTRDQLTNSLMALRERQLVAGHVAGFRASTDMMVAVTEDINERIGRLPRTIRVKSNAVRPSIALAYRVYGDSAVLFNQARDIARRNNIAHPGFAPARALEVLLNG